MSEAEIQILAKHLAAELHEQHGCAFTPDQLSALRRFADALILGGKTAFTATIGLLVAFIFAVFGLGFVAKLKALLP